MQELDGLTSTSLATLTTNACIQLTTRKRFYTTTRIMRQIRHAAMHGGVRVGASALQRQKHTTKKSVRNLLQLTLRDLHCEHMKTSNVHFESKLTLVKKALLTSFLHSLDTL